ncbi:hypothetical protein MKX01_012738 [Papaver californicum]|nr:hypothetical protein MKX01_012738 [Papaver californicum]
MANRSSCRNFVLAFLFSVVFMSSHTVSDAIQCKSGEIFASCTAVVCPPCGLSCQAACPDGSTVTSTNCVYRLSKLPLCEYFCKMPPKPPPPSLPPPPSPPPPPPSCTEECPYEIEYTVSPDQEQPCVYVLADDDQTMIE